VRQVQVIVTCDPCKAWHDSENSEGVQTVPVAGGQTLDLCPSHRTDLAPFLALVAEWGATPSSTGRIKRATPVAPTPVAAAPTGNTPSKRGGKRARARRASAEPGAELPLTCPLCDHVSVSAGALTAHVGSQHQTTLTTLYGGTCPVCAHEGDARGLGTHANKGHQVGSAAALFALAQSQGDPHGVIAGRALAVSSQ
jgi:hypothetical protein